MRQFRSAHFALRSCKVKRKKGERYSPEFRREAALGGVKADAFVVIAAFAGGVVVRVARTAFPDDHALTALAPAAAVFVADFADVLDIAVRRSDDAVG